jgi:hypothetical protein
MAKRTFSKVFSVADTTAWRARVSEISDSLTAVGLPQAADTGQIDPATTTLPSAGSDAGYEIRYLNDSLHTTAPVFLRIVYGRYSGGGLRIKLNMGLSTNGAGTITGLNTGEIDTSWGIAPATPGAIPSYFCAGPGFAWMSYMMGHAMPDSVATMSAWAIMRTVDAAGEITSDGVALYYTNAAESNPGLLQRVISRASSSVFGAHRSYCMVVGALASTETGSGPQVYRHWCPLPAAARLRHIATYVNPEISAGAITSLDIVGGVLDYLALGPQIPKSSVTSTTDHCVLLPWTGSTV